MGHCYKHVIESTKVVRRLVGGSSASLFQLNEHQCQILVEELLDTTAFLKERSACLKFGEEVGSISLRHLCSAVERAKVLVEKCCCKDLESWLVSAMMLVEIQEEFVVIILDIRMWKMLLDFAITCGRGLSQEEKVEKVKIIDEEYHLLFKDLHRESNAVHQAAIKDKETIISRTSRIVDVLGSTSGLDYMRAIYLQSWLTSIASPRSVHLTKYEFVNVLGQGGCSTVLKVKWLGIECALKVSGGQDEKEATALKGLFHPNIIRLFHYWEDGNENLQSHLLMELMPQDLGTYMKGLLKGTKMQTGKDSMPFLLPVAIDIMYQIAQAMRYMHEKHLTHRDLKPANILVKEHSRMGLSCIDGEGYLDIKLADFGLVKSYTNTSTFQAHSRNKGTGMYRAPEIFGKDMSQKRHYLPMADVWSFGITCVEILTGKHAYVEYLDDYGSDIQTLIREEGLRPTLPKYCPPYLAFCIKSCWEYMPSRRPTFANLCKLLRHAKLLSLGVTKLDDSKLFFAYTTRSDQVQCLSLSRSSSKARVSTFVQSSLKFMGIGSSRVPSAAEAATMHEVRLVSTPSATEDSPELHKDIDTGGIAPPGSLSDGEDHSSAVLPATDIVHEERVVVAPMVTEESPLQMPDKDVVGSVITLASPSQRGKSVPDLEESAEPTQASLDNVAVSPPDASDPIQPAVIPRQKLDRKMSKIEAVSPLRTRSGNRSKTHSRQNNQKPDRLLSHIQDCFQGKVSEPELPEFLKPASASIIPPIASPPAYPKGINDGSPRSSIRNTGSQEAVDYQFRAPPRGSFQDDVTGPSPETLLMAVMRVKSSVKHFAKFLIMNINKHPVELEYLKQTILREVRADMDRANHWKFLVQAFICKRLFDGFDAPNRYFGVEYFENDQMTKLISFADFSKFKDKASTISMLLDSDSPDGSFLGRFCFKKFKSISGYFYINQPFSIYQEEWDTIERERHPKTEFYQSFLKVAVSVWLVHRLVHSFEEKVEMLIYENGANFERQTMESVVPGSYEEEDEEADANTEVGFSVIPGFQVSRSVVKCEVYLRRRSRHPEMEITGSTSTEKTPVSVKTSVNPHPPELPVREDNNIGSMQPVEGLNSS